MTSQIRFDPPNVEGLVAAGTTVAAAAERLGVDIKLECGGVGECTSCAVRMVENPFALTPLTDAERRMLGEERIAEGIRLGCQARLHEGDCVVHVLETAERPGEPETESSAEAARARVFEAFDALPASDQFATALELQLKAAGDLLGALFEAPIKVGEQLFGSILGNEPGRSEPENESKGKEEASPGTEREAGDENE